MRQVCTLARCAPAPGPVRAAGKATAHATRQEAAILPRRADSRVFFFFFF